MLYESIGLIDEVSKHLTNNTLRIVQKHTQRKYFVQKPITELYYIEFFPATFFIPVFLLTNRKQTVYNRSNLYSTNHSQGKNEFANIFRTYGQVSL